LICAVSHTFRLIGALNDHSISHNTIKLLISKSGYADKLIEEIISQDNHPESLFNYQNIFKALHVELAHMVNLLGKPKPKKKGKTTFEFLLEVLPFLTERYTHYKLKLISKLAYASVMHKLRQVLVENVDDVREKFDDLMSYMSDAINHHECKAPCVICKRSFDLVEKICEHMPDLTAGYVSGLLYTCKWKYNDSTNVMIKLIQTQSDQLNLIIPNLCHGFGNSLVCRRLMTGKSDLWDACLKATCCIEETTSGYKISGKSKQFEYLEKLVPVVLAKMRKLPNILDDLHESVAAISRLPIPSEDALWLLNKIFGRQRQKRGLSKKSIQQCVMNLNLYCECDNIAHIMQQSFGNRKESYKMILWHMEKLNKAHFGYREAIGSIHLHLSNYGDVSKFYLPACSRFLGHIVQQRLIDLAQNDPDNAEIDTYEANKLILQVRATTFDALVHNQLTNIAVLYTQKGNLPSECVECMQYMNKMGVPLYPRDNSPLETLDVAFILRGFLCVHPRMGFQDVDFKHSY
jgi:hypothetical protein